MRHRDLGSTALTVGEIGLGCWQLGGADWGDLDEDTAFATLRAALDAGVDFLDTADVYGAGRSEELIGNFTSKLADRPFIATKVGRFAGCGFPDEFTFAGIRDCTEASLRRLGVEALDLTQLHCVPTAVLRHGEIFMWLRQLQEEGKVLRFGASVESMDEAMLCMQQKGLCSLQIIFNILRQKPIDQVLERARASRTALIVRLPLASGLLGGNYTKRTRFGVGDHRTYNRDGQAFNVGETFAGLEFDRGVELADALKTYVPDGLSLPQMAIRWILDYPEVTVVIPGARDPAQAHANAMMSLLPPLPESLHTQLRDFYFAEVAGHIRGPY